MSITEILVVLIVALIIIKPEDLPILVKQVRNIRRYLRSLTSDIVSKLDEPENLSEDPEEINRYLEKILASGDKYEGEYDLNKIKKYYGKLLKKQSKAVDLKQNE